MPTDLYRQLALECDRLGRRRPDLVAAFAHPGVASVQDLFAVIRSYDDIPASDHAVRVLARLGASDPDAVTLIVGALAPQLHHRASPGRTREFREDLICELTVVVYDAICRGELGGCDRLADRLRSRAHARATKRDRRARIHGEVNLTTTDPCSPDTFALLHAQHGPAPDFDSAAELATARVDLERFGAACRDAVAEGSLSARSWDAYRDHRLRRVLAGSAGPVPDAARKRAERAATRLRVVVDDLLDGHAA